jgi:hypothetical protein
MTRKPRRGQNTIPLRARSFGVFTQLGVTGRLKNGPAHRAQSLPFDPQLRPGLNDPSGRTLSAKPPTCKVAAMHVEGSARLLYLVRLNKQSNR